MDLRKTSLRGTPWEGMPEDLVSAALQSAQFRYGGNLRLKDWARDTGSTYRFGVTVNATKQPDEPGPRGGKRFKPAPGVSMNFPYFHAERPIHAACWHAFRDVLAELFILCPQAVVVTAIATYRGFDGFMRDFPQTAHRNAGSQIFPMELAEKCFCEDPVNVPYWLAEAYRDHLRETGAA